jgi:hypothetical protein
MSRIVGGGDAGGNAALLRPVVLITGASFRVGAALARLFLRTPKRTPRGDLFR